MKKQVGFMISLILVLGMFCAGCGGGPLQESEVVGDYGAFECDDENSVWSKCPYVTIGWEVTDPDSHTVKFTYSIEDDNIESYDEDYWQEYHEAGFENPEDALEEYFDDIIDDYEVPPEGYYRYERSENKLVYEEDSSIEYYKKD